MKSENSEKIPIASKIPSVANFRSVLKFKNFPQFAFYRRFENQQLFDAMNAHHFKEPENRMQIQLINLRILDI